MQQLDIYVDRSQPAAVEDEPNQQHVSNGHYFVEEPDEESVVVVAVEPPIVIIIGEDEEEEGLPEQQPRRWFMRICEPENGGWINRMGGHMLTMPGIVLGANIQLLIVVLAATKDMTDVEFLIWHKVFSLLMIAINTAIFTMLLMCCSGEELVTNRIWKWFVKFSVFVMLMTSLSAYSYFVVLHMPRGRFIEKWDDPVIFYAQWFWIGAILAFSFYHLCYCCYHRCGIEA